MVTKTRSIKVEKSYKKDMTTFVPENHNDDN